MRIFLASLLLCGWLVSVCAAAPDSPAGEGDWAKMKSIVPRGYVCYRARTPITIDGKRDEPAWSDAPWTEEFVDIQGSAKPVPRFRTRAKLLWDDRYLYVFAEIQEPHVWGTLKKKNDIIFFDNDFEVFIDPNGDNHNYYEFEINALNTIWELTLDKPYRDGGPAHLGTNLEGLRSAIHIDGTLNDPADTDRGWSVELAFPWAGLAKYADGVACPPKDGQQWRLGMSRVEWLIDIIDGKYRKVPREVHPEDNWVWSPQGVIDMHRPERWGFVQFSTAAPGSAQFNPDPTLPARDRLMEIYYRQKEYKAHHEKYAASLQELGISNDVPADQVEAIRMEPRDGGYVATTRAKLPDGSIRALQLREDSKLSIVPAEPEAQSGEKSLEIHEAVALSRVAGGGRSAVPVDPLWSALARDTLIWPVAGDSFALASDRTVTWQHVEAGKDGWFQGGAIAGGYVACNVELSKPAAMLLHVEGDAMALVNGEPHTGDPYATGYLRVPVALHRGTNHLLFSCARGKLRVRLDPVRAPVMLDTADLTLPDILITDRGTLIAGVVVINATDQVARHLQIRAQAEEHTEATTTDFPVIPPMSIRKVPVRIVVPANPSGQKLKFTLQLHSSEVAKDAADVAEIELRVRKPTDVYKRTFISRIDGSVQYYAVNPAQKPSDQNLLVLTLHGAAVEALGQASAYASKDDVTLVAPTNRRPYGFDWEDMGRLDAIEVLDLAERTIPHDPHRVVLTGHSMGGHGTWHIGLTLPDRFAAIGPSAGWSSFFSYGGGRRLRNPDAIQKLMARAVSPSDTLALVRNSLMQDVYILHGDADDNVPVREARAMREAINFHPRLEYHEEKGAGHWWGSRCVDWPPMFEMFAKAKLPDDREVNEIEFTTEDPAVSGRCHWATIEQQVHALEPSTIKLRRDSGRITGTTMNVAAIILDAGAMGGEVKQIEIDGQTLDASRGPESAEKGVVLVQRAGKWSFAPRLDPSQKSARRGGPFKQAFANGMVLVYGTAGTSSETAEDFNDARLFAENLYYRGNGAPDLMSDAEFLAAQMTDRNVILFGNADTNSAWSTLMHDCPITVKRGSVHVADHARSGEGLAVLMIYPRAGSTVAQVGVIAATGAAGHRIAQRLPLLTSGVAYPDWIVIGSDSPAMGDQAIAGAGFFANDWTYDPTQSAWKQ